MRKPDRQGQSSRYGTMSRRAIVTGRQTEPSYGPCCPASRRQIAGPCRRAFYAGQQPGIITPDAFSLLLTIYLLVANGAWRQRKLLGTGIRGLRDLLRAGMGHQISPKVQSPEVVFGVVIIVMVFTMRFGDRGNALEAPPPTSSWIEPAAAEIRLGATCSGPASRKKTEVISES